MSISLTLKTINTTSFYGTIQTIEESNKTNKLLVKVDNSKVIIYISKNIEVKVGDYGYYNCTKSNSTSNIYNGSFDYNKYLYDSYIDGVYFVNDYEYIKNKFVISSIQDNIKTYFENNLSNETLKYSLMLILGIDSFDDIENDVISNLGIMHLFCISGMHINFILLVVSMILKKFNCGDNLIHVIQILFAIILLIITNFQISVIRAFLMFILAYIFKKKKIDVTSLDILCLSAIIILIFRPRYFNLLSFRLTYLVTFILILTSDLYNNKSMIKTLCMQSVIAFATTLPLIINMNYQINFMAIFNATFISIPFTYIVMPITFISAILKTSFFNPVLNLFNLFLLDLNKLKMFVFTISKLSIISIVIYYILFYLILKSIYIKKHLYKLLITLFVFILIILNITKLDNETKVTFFNVGQGDSTLISLPFNQGNILIDCFGGVSNFIKTRGINKIDYLIITHAHNDHMGDLDIVKETFDVGMVVGSYYDQDSMLLGFDKYVKGNDTLMFNNIPIYFLAPYSSHSDINRASLVFTIKLHDYIFMFTGDTTKEVEVTLLNKNIKSDVLKVPHHGSITSSSVEFVEAVNPKYAIFSYGENNSHGLPNYEVISRYYMSTNYHTAKDGTIEFYYVNEWKVRLHNKKFEKYLFL